MYAVFVFELQDYLRMEGSIMWFSKLPASMLAIDMGGSIHNKSEWGYCI